MSDALPFDRFTILPGARQLLVEGQPAVLGARAFDLLLALVARRDRVVGKHELLDLVWPGMVVEENNLQVQVSTLRKLLGPQAIATVPGRGYRFVAETVGHVAPAAPAAQPAPGLSVAKAAAPVRPGNVPLDPGALLGRDAELAELESLVAAHRMVSVVGAGGIGKTRVALALADRARANYADGAWWVELAALSDPRLVADTIARTVGVALAAGRAPEDALASALAGLDLLLVLDNCEHLLASVSSVVDALLTRCPTVHMVATSQEPLRTRAEQLVRLGSLALPEPDAPVAAADAAGYSAVALFVERARAADRHFRLAPGNVAAVVEICRRLDGIPLAIELASARVAVLGIETLRQRLDDRFRLLTAGARTVLRRHQTLRAALEWSHGLLGVEEQAVFRRLGVCAGGCTLAFAQALAADQRLDEWAVLDALGHLVDKSLVVAEGADAPRYRLLETTRAYAIEQLSAAGETDALLRRHAEVLLEQLRRLGAGRWRVDSGRETFAFELDNLRAALDWATGADGDAALAVALLAESVHVWFAVAGQGEGLRRARAIAPRLPPDTRPAERAQFWSTFAHCGVFSVDRECFEAAQRAADLWRELGDDGRRYEALIVRAAIAGRRRDAAAAAPALAEAQRIEQAAWPAHRRASLAFAQWIVALNDNREDEARSHAQRQAELNRQAGNRLGEMLARGNVASSDVWGGQPARAVPALRATVADMEQAGYGSAAGHMVYNLGAALAMLGEQDEAYLQLRRAYALLRREGDQGILFGTLVRLNAARGHTAASLRTSGYARALWQRLGLDVERLVRYAEALLPDMIDAAERAARYAEGAALTEEQVFAQALADAD